MLILAPAFPPPAGRTAKGGRQLLDGVDLGASSFAARCPAGGATGEIERLLEPLPSQLWVPGSDPRLPA